MIYPKTNRQIIFFSLKHLSVFLKTLKQTKRIQKRLSLQLALYTPRDQRRRYYLLSLFAPSFPEKKHYLIIQNTITDSTLNLSIFQLGKFWCSCFDLRQFRWRNFCRIKLGIGRQLAADRHRRVGDQRLLVVVDCDEIIFALAADDATTIFGATFTYLALKKKIVVRKRDFTQKSLVDHSPLFCN